MSAVESLIDPRTLGAKCDGCPLCGPDGPRPVYAFGSRNAHLILVGEAPGEDEVRSGAPFTGRSGQLLTRTLKAARLEREAVYTTNAVLCHPEDNKTPSATALDACDARLRQEILSLPQRHVIMGLGNSAARVLLGKTQPISRLNGQVFWSEEWGAFLTFAYHPAAVLRKSDYLRDYIWAFEQTIDLLDRPKGPIVHTPTTYLVEDTLDGAVEHLNDLYRAIQKKPDHVVACDIETEGFDWHKQKILELGFSTKPGFSYILPQQFVYHPRIKAVLQHLFEDRAGHWVWHNGKFDVLWIRQHLQIKARINSDTMLLHYMLDERSGGEEGGAHDLKTLGMKYCGAPNWAADIKRYLKKKDTPMTEVPPEERHRYHAHDCDYTLRLYYKMIEELDAEAAEFPPRGVTHAGEKFHTPRWTHDNILIPLANRLADIEAHGVYIDRRRLSELDAEWSTRIEEYTRQVQWYGALAVRPLETRSGLINVRSPIELAHIIYDQLKFPLYFDAKKRQKIRTTNADALLKHIKMVEDNPEKYPQYTLEFLTALKEYRQIAHQHNVYIVGFRKRMDANGRLHTTIKIHGTATGRLASVDPNLFVIPRDSVIKQLFIGTPGYTFFEADYAQLEVRSAAFHSRDPQLIIDLRSEDFHWTMAQRIFGPIVADLNAAKGDIAKLRQVAKTHRVLHSVVVRLEEADLQGETFTADEIYTLIKKRLRFQVKFVTFGVIYGRGVESLADPLNGLGVSPQEAAEFLARFHRTYSVWSKWSRQTINDTFKTGWVETPNGRRRRYPYIDDSWRKDVNTQSANHPVQSFAADLTLRALIRLHDELTARGWGYVLFSVHDSIACEIKNEYLEEGRQLIKNIMETVVIDPDILFQADVESGPSWAACK